MTQNGQEPKVSGTGVAPTPTGYVGGVEMPLESSEKTADAPAEQPAGDTEEPGATASS